MAIGQSTIEFHPATPERWVDLRKLFEAAAPDAAGNPRGCWCMEWRLPRRQWKAQVGDANRAAMETLVASGAVPGVLAYRGGEPIGWCSVSPRASFAGLRDAGCFGRFDEPGVWSIVCFYLRPELRGQRLMAALLSAAMTHAVRHGARIVEAYPVDPAITSGAWEQTGFMGITSVFRTAGFVKAPERDGGLDVPGYTDSNRTMRYHVGTWRPAGPA